jgi:hypothetical protein
VRRGLPFWAGAAAGWAVMGYAVRGALAHDIDTRPGELARFLVGGALAHDLVLAPAVLLAGAALARMVRRPWRAPMQAGLVVTGMVALFAYPLVRGYGRAHRNPSSLPRDYGEGLAVVVAAVWLVVAALELARAVKRRRARAPGPAPS